MSLRAFGQHRFGRACANRPPIHSTWRLAGSRISKTLQKSPGKSRGIAWKDKDVGELIELMKEETIMFSLENAKTPKEKRAVYKSVQVQLQNNGNVQLVANIAH